MGRRTVRRKDKSAVKSKADKRLYQIQIPGKKPDGNSPGTIKNTVDGSIN